MEQLPAYLAGFLDGEGYIGIHKNGDRFSLRVSVTQLDPRPLIEFQRVYGGNLHRAPDKRGFRALIVWSIVGHRATEMLRAVRPWLTVKADQVDLALEFQARIEGPDRDRAVEITERQRLYRQISALKQQTYDHIELPVLEPLAQDHKGPRLRWAKPKPPKKAHVKIAAPVRSTGYDRKKKPNLPEDVAIFAAIYHDHGLTETAREYGVSRQTILNWLESYGIEKQGRTPASERRRLERAAQTWR